MNERCIFCYDPYQDRFEELVGDLRFRGIKPTYTICDKCMKGNFPTRTKQEVINMLKTGMWINGVCHSISEDTIII